MTLRFVVALLCCVSSLVSARAQAAKENLQFTVQPEMRHATESSIELVWKTNIATNGQIVIYGNKYRKQIDVNEISESHEVTISDLEPGSTYYYRIIAKDGPAGIVCTLKNGRTTGDLISQDASKNGIERSAGDKRYTPSNTPINTTTPTTEDR